MYDTSFSSAVNSTAIIKVQSKNFVLIPTLLCDFESNWTLGQPAFLAWQKVLTPLQIWDSKNFSSTIEKYIFLLQYTNGNEELSLLFAETKHFLPLQTVQIKQYFTRGLQTNEYLIIGYTDMINTEAAAEK